jgi:hypothetical protein
MLIGTSSLLHSCNESGQIMVAELLSAPLQYDARTALENMRIHTFEFLE